MDCMEEMRLMNVQGLAAHVNDSQAVQRCDQQRHQRLPTFPKLLAKMSGAGYDVVVDVDEEVRIVTAANLLDTQGSSTNSTTG